MLFLDRDGVINRRRLDHVKSWSEFEFLPGALLALHRLHEEGERVVIVTNQSVVGRGLISVEELTAIHTRMIEAVRDSGGVIERVYSCIHTPTDGCSCRKPRPGLLQRAAMELRAGLEHSVVVGDSISDMDAARLAGCQAIFVGDARPRLLPADFSIAVDLAEAVTAALGERVNGESVC